MGDQKTLRDEFAMRALSGTHYADLSLNAKAAYAMADAMLAEREKGRYIVEPVKFGRNKTPGGFLIDEADKFISNIHSLVEKHGIPDGQAEITGWLDEQLTQKAGLGQDCLQSHREIDALKTENAKLKQELVDHTKQFQALTAELAKYQRGPRPPEQVLLQDIDDNTARIDERLGELRGAQLKSEDDILNAIADVQRVIGSVVQLAKDQKAHLESKARKIRSKKRR